MSGEVDILEAHQAFQSEHFSGRLGVHFGLASINVTLAGSANLSANGPTQSYYYNERFPIDTGLFPFPSSRIELRAQ